MDSLPSPSNSPGGSPSSTVNLGRKRARSSASSDASSSKRAMSEDPSQAGNAKEGAAQAKSPTVAEGHASSASIDAYMREQGEEDEQNLTFQPSGSMRPIDTPAKRYGIIQALRRAPMRANDTWYIVSTSWYRRWQKACTGTVDKEGPLDEADLGPVDNSEFFDDDGKLFPRPDWVEGDNVEFVHVSIWRCFETWYGESQYPIPRRVIQVGKETRLELHPPTLQVLRLIQSESLDVESSPSVHITISASDSLESLFNLLKESMSLPHDAVIRVWLLDYQVEDKKTFSSARLIRDKRPLITLDDPRKTVENTWIQDEEALIVEVQEDGKWIVNKGDVESTDGPLFTSGSDFFSNFNSNTSSIATQPTTTYGPRPEPSEITKAASAFTSLIATQPTTTYGPPGPSENTKTTAAFLGKGKTSGRGHKPGTLGLVNMGNTCFMNSALQCLAHTEVLVDYFLTNVYSAELNPDNPLGMQGEIAEAFGYLLERIWASANTTSYAPREFKMQLQRFAPQFSGYQQHDSQELVAFLLDGLHEDLNRIKKKPYVEKPDWEGGGDKELVQLAKDSWKGYLQRNDSVIVDLFQGQYRSTLVCPECQKVSITFDPFMYLTLPLPVQKKWTHKIYYIPWDVSKEHVRIPVEVNRNASFKEVRQLLGRWMETEPDNLLTMEVFSNRFYKDLDDTVPVADMTDTDVIVCYELPCHAQQSRTWKPDPDPTKDPLIVPVHLCKEHPSTRYTSYTRTTGFSYPFIIVLDYDQLRSKDKIYAAVIERLERWTEQADSLYTREASDSVEQVNFSTPRGSTPVTEIRENGEIKVVVEDVPDEGDIADEKSTIFEENAPVQVKNGTEVVRKVRPKPALFQMHIQTGHERLGTGAPSAWSSSIAQKWETWEAREKAFGGDDLPALLHEGDALFCEWDTHLRQFFFGDEPNYEAGRWTEDNWGELVHAEYKAARKAASRQKKGITLHDCLLEFTKEEQLGEDDLWYCPRCKKHQQATKKFDLWTVPDILVVHLKRFSNSRMLRDKIDAFVDFPTEGLDLSEFCGEREVTRRLSEQGVNIEELGLTNADEPLIYDLYAVDEHLGGLGGGHYRAYALNSTDDTWYHFDDSFVNRASASDAVNANAYLLFYKRRTTDRPLGGKSHELIKAAQSKDKDRTGKSPDVQLPTPPNEDDGSFAMRSDLEDGTSSNGTVYGRSSALDAHVDGTKGVLRRGARSLPTPPLASSPSASAATDTDTELPSFEDSQYDEIVAPNELLTFGFEYPDPSSSGSPSSSVEVEADDVPIDFDVDNNLFEDSNAESDVYNTGGVNDHLTFNAADNPSDWPESEGWGERLDTTAIHTKEGAVNGLTVIPLGQSSLLDIDE